MSHTTVARRADALEAELDGPLFDGHRDGDAVPPDGRRLLPAVTCCDGDLAGFVLPDLRVRRVLRPGGRVVSSTPCLGDGWVPYRPILAVLRWLGKAPTVTLLTQRALREAMVEAGFVDLEDPDVGEDATTAFLVARAPG